MVTGFPARVIEMIDSLIAKDKLDYGDLKLIRDEVDFMMEDLDFYKGTDDE
tara:strand:- start:86 stop:238 length:153 start_codon:yes stop_codon:yes gene_type:complete